MAHINTVEAIRRSLADEHGDEDAAIARSIADEVDRQHEAARHKARTSSRSTPPAPPVATQDALVRHHQPQQQQQQHQQHQRESQQQHARTEYINPTEATDRGTADRNDDDDAAITRSVVEGADGRQQSAGRLTNNNTNERRGQQQTQHNITLTCTPIPAVHNSTIQLVPRKTDESSDTSLMTGDEQWPADDDSKETARGPTSTCQPTDHSQTTPDTHAHPQQPIGENDRATIPTPAPNPDNITPASPRRAPSKFHPCKRKPGRRVVTWFSGYDGFREAAIVHEPKWQVAGGTEDVESDKGRRIATLWEDNNPDGRILGHHTEVQQRLRDGTLQLGHVDLHVITYPCWDHADCHTEGRGDDGEAGSFIGEAHELLDAISTHHKISGLIYEDVPSIVQYASFANLLKTLEEPSRRLASSWCIVDTWRLGSPTRRKRVVVVAGHHDSLKTGALELPLPGDDRMPASGLRMPTATNCLEPADTIPESYRVSSNEYEELGDDHYQYAWPAVQVGRLLNEPKNHYVYDPNKGPVATIRANMFKAEGPGKNTGLIIDELGPRRITPTECARIHGFNTTPIQHLTQHQIYSLIGNSVTVHMARIYLQYFDRVLR